MMQTKSVDRSGSFNKPDDAARPFRWLHLINALLFVGLWIFVFAAYGSLPEQIPHHMGADGRPTRMGDRGMWFFLPIIMSTNLVVMYGLSMSAMTADGFNVPHKKKLRALPRDQQRYALQPMRGFLLGMATWLLALSWVIQLEIYQAALRGYGSGYILAIILVFTALPVAALLPLNRAVRRRIEQLEGEPV